MKIPTASIIPVERLISEITGNGANQALGLHIIWDLSHKRYRASAIMPFVGRFESDPRLTVSAAVKNLHEKIEKATK